MLINQVPFQLLYCVSYIPIFLIFFFNLCFVVCLFHACVFFIRLLNFYICMDMCILTLISNKLTHFIQNFTVFYVLLLRLLYTIFSSAYICIHFLTTISNYLVHSYYLKFKAFSFKLFSFNFKYMCMHVYFNCDLRVTFLVLSESYRILRFISNPSFTSLFIYLSTLHV